MIARPVNSALAFALLVCLWVYAPLASPQGSVSTGSGAPVPVIKAPIAPPSGVPVEERKVPAGRVERPVQGPQPKTPGEVRARIKDASTEPGTDLAEPDIMEQEPQFLDEAALQLESGKAEPEATSVRAISEQEAEFLIESESQMGEDFQESEIGETATNVETASDDIQKSIRILGKRVKPGEMRRLRWVASETFYGGYLDTPVIVIHGKKPGLTLCLTAAIHGDELNGVEIVRQLINDLSPAELSGTVIGVPIVNLLGFTRGARYLPDRRDLNRYFPGNPNGSSASRIAHSFFEEIVSHCDRLVDFHTGSLNRTNMPQIRANMNNPSVMEFTTHFGSTAVLHSRKLRGNLRSAATDAGIPAVAMELGEPGTLQKKHIKDGVKIIETLLSKLEMVKRHRGRSEPQPVYYSSRWVRVDNGGLMSARVKVGARIRKGAVLGTMINPLSNETFEVISPYSGRVLGMALNQFMLPGYAAFNIGIVADETTILVDAQAAECTNTDMDPDQIGDEFSCNSSGNGETKDDESATEDNPVPEETELH